MTLTATTIGLKASGKSAWLSAPAAESYARMLTAGCPAGGITDAGRTYTQQVELFTSRYTTVFAKSSMRDRRVWQGRTYWRRWGVASAATPGESNHEDGNALDLAGDALAWVRTYGAPFGWVRDAVKGETWHLEYRQTADRRIPAAPAPAPAPTTPTQPAQEDDDMITTIIWCYTELVGRTPTTDEVSAQVAATAGRNAAQVVDGFLATRPERASVVKAYRDYLGRDPESDAVIAERMSWHASIRAMRVALADAAASGAR